MLDRFEEMVLNLQGSHYARRLRDRKRFFAGDVLQLSVAPGRQLLGCWRQARVLLLLLGGSFVKEIHEFHSCCDFCFGKKKKEKYLRMIVFWCVRLRFM